MTTKPRPPFEWLLCPDCASTVHEVLYGTRPNIVLSIELEHSPTCPAPKEKLADNGNEIMLQFLPSSIADRGAILGDEGKQ